MKKNNFTTKIKILLGAASKNEKEENIIILTLKTLGINIVELLTRERIYQKEKLPREISDIIESYFVENVRFVNSLKRNIFTEKELSEETRVKLEILLEIEEIEKLWEEDERRKAEKGEMFKKMDTVERKMKEIDFRPFNNNTSINEIKKQLIQEITLELEAKERAENIEKLEKEELEAQKAELSRLSQLLTIKEKSVNSKLTEREEKIQKAEKKLEKAKVAVEEKIPTIIAEAEKEKKEAIRNLEQEKKNLEGKERTASENIERLENQIKELDKEIQHWNKESEILRKEINKELSWRQEGWDLREAVNNFIKEKCRNEKYVPTTGDKCLNMVTAPFKWVSNKVGTGFALFGFMTACPAILVGLGWVLKAFLVVKTGGVAGATMVANSMINHRNNNQGGNLPPNYQPLPPAENNQQNTQNLPPVINNHYHNLPGKNYQKKKKKKKDSS